jgi:hypothetical protein
MLIFLLLSPWVLTLVFLLFILIKGNMFEQDYDMQHTTIRVAVYEEKAYWVHDNIFYESEITREPDFETARPIDTMLLDPKELGNLLTILDDLKESEKE